MVPVLMARGETSFSLFLIAFDPTLPPIRPPELKWGPSLYFECNFFHDMLVSSLYYGKVFTLICCFFAFSTLKRQITP